MEDDATVLSTSPLEKMLSMKALPLPTPKIPSKCPLFCCFYAEFDIKKGPVICYQSPKNFMDQDINISTETMFEVLAKTFENLVPSSSGPANQENKDETKDQDQQSETSEQETTESSIFDAACDYIITGNELAGKLISLSSHSWHIISRPTLIEDSRYERNSLFFSVGIVLRQEADPRPFRPLISRLARTLHAMEVESKYLTKPALRSQIQPLLEHLLVSLNSGEWECNLLLSKSSALNLKLFHPPKPDTAPVLDHEVPILLRRDLQLQMYDWDLAINWVILHVDGVANARQISIRAEVDLEMVLACLRVLKHHGIIALVAQFSYTNRYEFTAKATAMLAGKEPNLLQGALDFVLKTPALLTPGPLPTPTTGAVGATGSDPSAYQHSSSPFQFPSNLSYPPRTMGLLGGIHQNHTYRSAMVQSLDKESTGTARREDNRQVKAMLAELYCSCHRNTSFGDIWVSFTTESLPPASLKSLRYIPSSNLRHGTARQSSISEDHDNDVRDHPLDALAMSPLESIHLDPINKTNKSPTEWNDFFKQIDHRRFFLFGLVHGLVVRIHNYPVYPFSFPAWKEYSTPQTPKPISTSPAPYTTAPTPQSTSVETKHVLKAGPEEEQMFKFARRVAEQMDGTRCDDELSCQFEQPFQKLVDAVEKYGGSKTVSVFAAAPDRK